MTSILPPPPPLPRSQALYPALLTVRHPREFHFSREASIHGRTWTECALAMATPADIEERPIVRSGRE